MNKQELIKKYKELWKEHSPFHEPVPYTSMVELFLKELKQLDEPKPVKVPQLVADWIKAAKPVYSLSGGMTYGSPGVNQWLENWDNQEIFVQAWIFGYEVEEEKRYVVKVKGICGNHETLNCEKHSKKWLFSVREENSLYKTKHTRKELEDAGFGEVFNSSLFEVVEVE